MAEDSSEEVTEIKVSCQCTQLELSVSVPKSSLPLPLWLCSCTTCRHLSGHLAITSIFLPPSYSDLKLTGHSARYDTSSGPSGLTRVFCPDCGTFVFEDSPNKNRRGLDGGSIVGLQKGLVELKGITFNGDAKDGGIAIWFPKDTLKVYEGNFGDIGGYDPTLNQHAQNNKIEARSEEILACSCHCGGVKFDVTRPNDESASFSGTGAYDPSRRSTPEWAHQTNSSSGEADDKWWIRGPNRSRYPAHICTCNSCRQSSGFDLQPWAFIPAVNIRQPNGAPFDFSDCSSGSLGTLKAYSSKEGVMRHFCGQCGANVFWREPEKTPLIVDVSVGLCDAASGSRAEEWFEWRPQICYGEYAQNKDLINLLEKGMAQVRDRQ